MPVRCHGQGGAAVNFVFGGQPVHGNQNPRLTMIPAAECPADAREGKQAGLVEVNQE
jgi:hypothetical protein